jgi:Flp pilus assembly protein TadD
VDTRRDTELAAKLNVQAAELLREGKLEGAETKLKAALSADLFYGPAHNNLGTLYQRQERYYEAAWEFQYATKLMPGKAQPKNNLGLVFESVGRLDESARWYEEALALEPDNVEITENLARVMVRTNRHSNRTRQLLSDIVMKERRPEWASWAREQLTMIGQPEPTPEPKPAVPGE